MRYRYTERAEEHYDRLPLTLQRRMDKQADQLIANMRHPSLKAKKYSEDEDYWQARINDDYRFYFFIDRNVYVIFAITKHPK